MKLSPDSTMKYRDFIKRYPRLGDAWAAIHEEESQGPLDPRTVRLVKLAVAMGAFREGAVHSAARKALKAGAIGKPYMARVRFAHTGPMPGWAKTDWFYNPKLAGGGAMLDMAIHAFDLLQFYLGPATAVQAKVATLRKKIAVEDNAVAILEFGPTAMGYVEAGWTSPAGFLGVEIMGDKGCITVDYSANKAQMTTGAADAAYNFNFKHTTLSKDPAPAWKVQMEHFTAQLPKKGPFRVGLDEGITALAIALGAYKSSKTGKRVPLS